jgi:hypothetical protein
VFVDLTEWTTSIVTMVFEIEALGQKIKKKAPQLNTSDEVPY